MALVSFSLQDALDDVACFRRALTRRQKWKGDDDSWHAALLYLKNDCLVDFTVFRPGEVLILLHATLPTRELLALGRRPSQFLGLLHSYWRPTPVLWAATLWQYCCRAHELFAQTLAANRMLPPTTVDLDGGDGGGGNTVAGEAAWGAAVFRDLPAAGMEGVPVGEHALQAVAACLVTLPRVDTFATWHEGDLAPYMGLLSPTEVGLVYNRLLLHRARPSDCVCGWLAGESGCSCQPALEYDRKKEYAFVVFRLACERRGRGGAATGGAWTPRQQAEFVKAACEGVFSAGVYREIYRNLSLQSEYKAEEPPLERPRVLSAEEKRANYARANDDDYSNDVSVHGGCVSVGCKFVASRKCPNSSCGNHCLKIGFLKCRAHRNPGAPFPHPYKDKQTPVTIELHDAKPVARRRPPPTADAS